MRGQKQLSNPCLHNVARRYIMIIRGGAWFHLLRFPTSKHVGVLGLSVGEKLVVLLAQWLGTVPTILLAGKGESEIITHSPTSFEPSRMALGENGLPHLHECLLLSVESQSEWHLRRRGVIFLTQPLPSLTAWAAGSFQPIELAASSGHASLPHEPNWGLD